MIVLRKEDLKDQEGMARAFRWYFENVAADADCRGTFNTMLGARFEACDYAKKTLTLSMEAQHWMANPSRMMHGGVTASLLDMAMGLLCRYCSGGFMTPTISMSVDYLRPAPIDRRLFIRAEITMCGFTVCHAVGSMWAEDKPEKLLATSAGSYYVTRRPE